MKASNNLLQQNLPLVLLIVDYFLKPVTYPWAAAGWGCFGSSFGWGLSWRWRRLSCSSRPRWFNSGWRWGGRCPGGPLRSSTRWRGTWGIFEVSWEWWRAGPCCGPLRRSSCLHQQHRKRRQQTNISGREWIKTTSSRVTELLCLGQKSTWIHQT